jgi:L-fucose mutarotase
VTVLQSLCVAIPIERACVMEPLKTGPYAMTTAPAIWAEFERVLRVSGWVGPLEQLPPATFYALAGSPDVVLTIATGEEAIYANVLLTIGAVVP